MHTDLASLRHAPLPDSFDRTATWLRSAPPPRPGPARPLLVAVALTAFVGACAWPVETDAVIGWAVEATVTDGRALVRTLDDVVAGVDRLSAAVEAGGAVRYVVATAEAAERARDAALQAGAAPVRTVPVDAVVRQPLGLAAARWLGVQATPRLSDAELQAALDQAFAGQRFAPRVERTADGRRALDLNPGARIEGLDPDTRIARSGSTTTISGGDLGGLSVGGVPLGRLRGADAAALQAVLDSAQAASPGGARVRRLDGDLRARLDSLGVDLAGVAGADSAVARGFSIRLPDSTHTP